MVHIPEGGFKILSRLAIHFNLRGEMCHFYVDKEESEGEEEDVDYENICQHEMGRTGPEARG